MGGVEEAVQAVRAGQPVVLPTDTVYGLCAAAGDAEAARAVYRLKRRPVSQPAALLCLDLETLLASVPELRGRPEAVARALLPGPYTLVLPNPAGRYPWLTGTTPEAIGVRVPVLPGVTLEVLGEVGAVLATSANLHGGPDPRRLGDVPEPIRAGCGAVVDGGVLPGTPSTVIDFTGAEPVVLREGSASGEEALARVEGVA